MHSGIFLAMVDFRNQCTLVILHQIYLSPFLHGFFPLRFITNNCQKQIMVKWITSEVIMVDTCPEWWHTTEENIKYDPSTPYINLLPIVLL